MLRLVSADWLFMRQEVFSWCGDMHILDVHKNNDIYFLNMNLLLIIHYISRHTGSETNQKSSAKYCEQMVLLHVPESSL